MYSNARYGFDLKLPEYFDCEEAVNGDRIDCIYSDPPMTIRVWGEVNHEDWGFMEALQYDQIGLENTEADDLEVIREKSITMGGEDGVWAVWMYNLPATGEDNISARAYTVKDENVYKIELIIDASEWREQENMFKAVVDNFNIG